MINKKYALSRKVLTTTGSILITGAAALHAESDELEETTILASKFDSKVSETTSTSSSITGEELDRQQITILSNSLNLIPGVQSNALGPTGSVSSLLTRGLPTDFTQVVVDGVSIADSTNGLGNFITSASNAQTTSLEFLRGPQSVIHGGEAVGGVLGYETKVGGENEIKLFGEAGSFDSYKTSASATGTIGEIEYGLEIGEEFTNNDPTPDGPLEDFKLNSSVLGIKWNATDDLNFKFTYRGTDSEFVSPFATTDVETELYTLNGSFRINDIWTSRLTLGRYDETSDSPFFSSTFDKGSINWANQIQIFDTFKVVAGYEYSDSEYSNSSNADVNFDTRGIYLNNYWQPTEALLIEAGFRAEEHSAFGGDTAWNVGASYHFANSGTRLRGRLTESFKTPTIQDSETFSGFASDQQANPNLKTETSFGYEIGIEQQIAEKHSINLTYFHQDIDDAIFTQFLVRPVFDAFFNVDSRGVTQQQNSSGESTVSGIEIEARGSFWEEKLNYRLAWTIQDEQDVIDVPNQLISADINYSNETWLVGLAADYVDGASYQNPALNANQIDERLVTRLYGSYEINQYLKLHARVENLFNEKYEISPFGDQGPGAERGYFAGVTITW